MDIGLLIAVLLLGALGGAIDHALTHGALVLPGYTLVRRDGSPPKRAFDPGVVGSLVVGACAALVGWAIGLTSPLAPQVYAAALVSGVGGTQVLYGGFLRQMLRSDKSGLAEQRDRLADSVVALMEKLESRDRELRALQEAVAPLLSELDRDPASDGEMASEDPQND